MNPNIIPGQGNTRSKIHDIPDNKGLKPVVAGPGPYIAHYSPIRNTEIFVQSSANGSI